VTCHNPHVSVKVTEKEHFNNVCRNCHHDAHAYDAKTPFPSGRVGDGQFVNCVHCHMPKNGTIDIPHVSVTDHYIRKPVDTAAVKKIKEFVTLACINNPSADAASRGNAFLSYYEKFNNNPAFLDSAKRYISDANDSDISRNIKSLVRWAYLKNDFQTVAGFAKYVQNNPRMHDSKSFSNDDAWTLYRIGESFSALQNYPAAIDYLMHAVRLEPFNLDFRNRLAQVQVDAQRIGDARKNFEFILSENPKFASAYVSLGYLILSVDHDIAKADSYYDKALALDPDNEQAMFNKAGTLMYLNKKPEAISMLKRLLKKNPQRADAKSMMAAISKQS
jgi:tetratricopeptide (TPR) repeat protein